MNEMIGPVVKECIQLTRLPQPTPCFRDAGSIPCVTSGCPVRDMIVELEKEKIKVNELWLNLFAHSRCRISSLSKDNGEFKKRLSKMKS